MKQSETSPVDPLEVLSLLRESEVFKEVPAEDLSALATGFVRREFPAGSIAVREGEQGREIFLITEGTFDVFASEADGRHRLDTLGAGVIFGEIAALTGGRRYATVQAAVDSTALVNEEANFHDILRASRPLSEAILRSLDRYA